MQYCSQVANKIGLFIFNFKYAFPNSFRCRGGFNDGSRGGLTLRFRSHFSLQWFKSHDRFWEGLKRARAIARAYPPRSAPIQVYISVYG